MRAILLIAGTDLRRRLRNRSFFVYAIGTPLLLATLVSVAFSGGGGVDTTIAVVDLDRSQVSAGIVDGLNALDEESLRIEPVESITDARSLLGDENAGAAIVIPEGFEAAAMAPRPLRLTVLEASGEPISGDIATALADGVVARVATTRLALTTLAVVTGAPPDETTVAAATALAPALGLGGGEGLEEFDAMSYFAPAMGLFFLFFTVPAAARSLFTERREGTLARVRAAPVTDTQVLAGKTLGVALLGLVAFGAVYVASTVLFGADWGATTPAVAVIVATVLAVVGIGVIITALARTEAQADGLASIVTFAFALAGGNFIGPDDAPDALQIAARATPNGWALQAFTDLSAGRGGVDDVAVALLVLVGIAAVSGTTGFVALHRRVLR